MTVGDHAAGAHATFTTPARADHSRFVQRLRRRYSAEAALLAAGFTGLYPDGFAGRADHARQLAQGPTVATFTLTQARVLELAPDVALLAYHARYTRPKGETAEQMWVSSIWQRAGAGWINIFSQDTPCDAPFIPV